MGSRINIPGSFWTGCPPSDKAKLLAVVVVEVSQNHRFNEDTVPDLWMLAKVWHDFEKMHSVYA